MGCSSRLECRWTRGRRRRSRPCTRRSGGCWQRLRGTGSRSGCRGIERGVTMAKAQKPTDIDGYISKYPADVQAVLRDVREAIRRAAPEAEETISYQMPAFRQHGILVYFAAWKKHIGLY